jgi:hypothetical protein
MVIRKPALITAKETLTFQYGRNCRRRRGNHRASSSATQAHGVAQIIREFYAVLLQLNLRFSDSRQQLMILSTPRRILINPTHDSRRHDHTDIVRDVNLGIMSLGDMAMTDNKGLMEINRKPANLRDRIDISWLAYRRANSLDDLRDNLFSVVCLTKELGDRNAVCLGARVFERLLPGSPVAGPPTAFSTKRSSSGAFQFQKLAR